MEMILNNCVFALPFVLIGIWLLVRRDKKEGSLDESSMGETITLEMDSSIQKVKWFHNPKWTHLVGVAMFAMMAAAILAVTGVTPTSGFKPYIHGMVNLVPFHGIDDVVSVASLYGGDPFILTNIFGNILLFVPFGFLLPLIWKSFSKFYRTILFGMGFSILIECSQLFLIRATDIDDVILNTIGTGIGYGCYRLFSKLFSSFSQKFHQYHTKIFTPFLFVALVYTCSIVRGAYSMYQYDQR